MKTVQEILGFVIGWQISLKRRDNRTAEEDAVYQTLMKIEEFIKT